MGNWNFGIAMSAVAVNAHQSLKFPIIFYGYETLTLVLRKGKRMMVFENRAFRKVSGFKSIEQETRENCTIRRFINSNFANNIRSSKSRRIRWHVQDR